MHNFRLALSSFASPSAAVVCANRTALRRTAMRFSSRSTAVASHMLTWRSAKIENRSLDGCFCAARLDFFPQYFAASLKHSLSRPFLSSPLWHDSDNGCRQPCYSGLTLQLMLIHSCCRASASTTKGSLHAKGRQCLRKSASSSITCAKSYTNCLIQAGFSRIHRQANLGTKVGAKVPNGRRALCQVIWPLNLP